jgi:hypothetical protein
MRVEFKEKTYEKYFGFELARRTKITYSPDQFDESFLGFDDAFFLEGPILMSLLRHTRRRHWTRLTGLQFSELDHVVDEISQKESSVCRHHFGCQPRDLAGCEKILRNSGAHPTVGEFLCGLTLFLERSFPTMSFPTTLRNAGSSPHCKGNIPWFWS